jgi:hypothetical protein
MTRNVNANAAAIFANVNAYTFGARQTLKRMARRQERQALNRMSRLAAIDAMANADAAKRDALHAQAELASFTFAALPDTTLNVSAENDLGRRVVRDTKIVVVRRGQAVAQSVRRDAFVAWAFCAWR